MGACFAPKLTPGRSKLPWQRAAWARCRAPPTLNVDMALRVSAALVHVAKELHDLPAQSRIRVAVHEREVEFAANREEAH